MNPPPRKTPVTINAMQLINVKMNPVVMDGSVVTSISSLPVIPLRVVKPNPSPIRRLNTGPAKQAVIAILARPFLAMVTLADRSAMELPQARIVKPITAEGIWQTMPRKLSRLTSLFATASI